MILDYILNKLYVSVVKKPSFDNIEQIQWRVLKQKLDYSSKSELGKRYKFSEIESISDYQKNVPVHKYDDLKDYWTREYGGEKSVTINSKFKHFVMSSGTTGSKKIIPVSSLLLADMRKSQLYFTSYMLQKFPHSKLLRKKILLITSRSEVEVNEFGSTLGMISGIMHKETSWLLRSLFLPSVQAQNIENLDEKYKKIADEIRNKKIGAICGIPAFVLNFINFLKGYFSKNEFEYFSNHLEFCVSSGTNFMLYRQSFNNVLNRTLEFYDVYTASEGSFGQMCLNDHYLEFLYDSIFFEFIPLNEFQNGNYTNRLLLNQLSVNEDYAILVTSGNGAFSYAIGDVIKSIDPKRMKFELIGRCWQELSLAGEKTSQYAVERVVTKLADVMTLSPGEFFLTSDWQGAKPCYIWVFEKNEIFENRGAVVISKLLDNFLFEENILYKEVYNKTIDQSRVIFIDPDRFKKWHMDKRDDPNHQKMPKIISDQKLVEAIIGKPLSEFL